MKEYLKSLNPEQYRAVSFGQGPLLIVAGAGTGKTTVITRRLAYLIEEEKCPTFGVLALTFTDKAAGEMVERVDRLLPYGYLDLWVSTFHSFAQRILNDHGLEIGLPINFKLLDLTGQWLLIRQNLEKFNLDYYRPLGNPTKFIHALVKYFSRLKDENISPEEYLKYAEELKMNSDSAEFFRTAANREALKKMPVKERKEVLAEEIAKQTELAGAYHCYQQLLLENSALDFGDLINYCLKLFQKRKNVLTRYRGQFRHILVDEFQDTNYAQYQLLKFLIGPEENITVVGDDDQSIFKFRGASISNILQFKKDFPEAKEISLTANYRSNQEILNLGYNFIQSNNPNRLEAKLGETGKISKKLIARKNSPPGEITHLHGVELADEAKMTIEKIIELKKKDDQADWSDFAVLVRANATAENFCYFLEKTGIPHNFLSSKGLYLKKTILDILSYLKILDDRYDEPAAYRLLTLPLWDFSQREIIELRQWAKRKGHPLFEALSQAAGLPKTSPEFKEKTAKIIELIERHLQLVRENKPTTEIVQVFLNDSGYLKQLTAEDSLANREKLDHLNQFYRKIQEFEKENTEKNLKSFLNQLDLELEAGDQGSIKQNLELESPETVKIMTIHTAKGLEFKYVFIVNLVDKRFPAINRSEPIELPDKLVKEIIPEGDIQLQEERRLFYVAVTRAKQGLYFTSAEDYGGTTKKKLSRFLIELQEQGFKLSSKAKPLGQPLDKEEPIIALEEESEFQPAIPKKFSFTQFKDFKTCPYQYRFRHILDIPTPGKPQISFGRTIHLTLENFFRLVKAKKENPQPNLFGSFGQNQTQKTEGSWEELLEIYRQSFIDDWYPDRQTKQQYQKKGREMLKNFYQRYQEEKPKVERLEFPFCLRIGEGDEEIALVGKIDRVDRVESGIKIIDYKTGESKGSPEKLSLDDKTQLLIYQLAARELIGEKIKELAVYYLEKDHEMTFLGTDKELEELEKKITKIFQEIKESNFPAKPGKICQWCDYRKICEFRSKTK